MGGLEGGSVLLMARPRTVVRHDHAPLRVQLLQLRAGEMFKKRVAGRLQHALLPAGYDARPGARLLQHPCACTRQDNALSPRA